MGDELDQEIAVDDVYLPEHRHIHVGNWSRQAVGKRGGAVGGIYAVYPDFAVV